MTEDLTPLRSAGDAITPEFSQAAFDQGGSSSTTNWRSHDRLWTALMSARVLAALALVSVAANFHLMSQALPLPVIGVSSAYLVLTILQRLLIPRSHRRQPFDRQWLHIAGVDLLYFGSLHLLRIADINPTPLLVLPVLMAAILGSRPLALGTAILAALVLVAGAVTGTEAVIWSSALLQAALTGIGLLALAWLANHLALRLAREEQRAQHSVSEARLQSLVNNLVIESLTDGVLVVDATQMVHTANPAARSMLGFDPEITPDVFHMTDDRAWSPLAELVTATFARHLPSTAQVILRNPADGSMTRLEIRTERTAPIGVDNAGLCVLFLQDLRVMEARLRSEKLASMGRMSAAIVHELRNPLAAISQANALLDEELTDSSQRRLTSMIAQNANRLTRIASDILDIASVPSDAAASSPNLPLDDAVAEVYDEWTAQHDARQRVRLELDTPEACVRFTLDHLRRLLVNLLDNAARYASTNSGAIVISTEAVMPATAMLRVWSDGKPLEASVQRHLFEPFFSSESRSSGLGLYICRELCRRHNATISYDRKARSWGNDALTGNEFLIRLDALLPSDSELQILTAT